MDGYAGDIETHEPDQFGPLRGRESESIVSNSRRKIPVAHDCGNTNEPGVTSVGDDIFAWQCLGAPLCQHTCKSTPGRLKLQGTNFRHELKQSRYAISQQLLTETNESLVDIAIALGYSNVSAFSRAFKQWSGKVPAKWRKEFCNF